MKRNWIGVLALAAGAAGIIAYKQIGRVPSAYADAKPPAGKTDKQAKTSLILVADLAEADESCGCGQVIRAVRAAAKRGVPTKEFQPGSDDKLLKQYKVTVAPTVLVIDPAGTAVARYEGESKDTVASLKAQLDKLK